MSKKRSIVIHLVSDSSGQTVKYVANSALAKFSGLEVKSYNWPMIRNTKLLQEVFDKVPARPGIVFHTLSDSKLRTDLKMFCRKMKLLCISVEGNIIKKLSKYIGTTAEEIAEEQSIESKFDKSYYNKVDAIRYTIQHDDGQLLKEIEEADIILIGPSRTSKTPTAIYLAYNGFKTINIPVIHNCPLPEELTTLCNPMVFGLVVDPYRLREVRESRMNLLQIKGSTNYTDITIVKDECRQTRRVCMQYDWKIIDVSVKSIEETAATIMQVYYDRKKLLKSKH